MMVPLELSHSIADVQFLNPLSAYVENYTEGPIPFDFSFAFGEHGAMFFEIIEVKRKLEEFAAMPDNWDGYGAIRIAPETKQSAKSAVEAICGTPLFPISLQTRTAPCPSSGKLTTALGTLRLGEPNSVSTSNQNRVNPC